MDMYWALGFATNVEGMFASEDYFAEVCAKSLKKTKIKVSGKKIGFPIPTE
jgi:hypothetical protein